MRNRLGGCRRGRQRRRRDGHGGGNDLGDGLALRLGLGDEDRRLDRLLDGAENRGSLLDGDVLAKDDRGSDGLGLGLGLLLTLL